MHNMAVRADEDWLKDTQSSEISSVRMFTSESYHRSFWDLAEHGVVLVDNNKNIIEANSYFVNLVGISAADLEGMNLNEIVGGKYIRTDNINLNALIRGAYYSYSNEEEIYHVHNRRQELVPVRIIVTRVPSTLTEDFQHFIIQVYKIEKAVQINGQPFVNQSEQSFINIFKNLLTQQWFVKMILWIIFFLLIALIISGDLIPIFEKIMPLI